MSSHWNYAHGTAGQPGYYSPAYGAPGYERVHATSPGGVGTHGEHVNEIHSSEGYEDLNRFAQGGKPNAYAQSYPMYPEYTQTIPASQGAAGYAYATHAHAVAPNAPLQPYSAEQSRSGHVPTSPTAASYTQTNMYNEYGQSPRTGQHAPSSAQAAFVQRGYPGGGPFQSPPPVVPSHGPRDTMTSSLAEALGPSAASRATSRIESSYRSDALPHPDMGMPVSPSSDYRNYSEYGSPYAEDVDFQFVVETGSPASVSSVRSARGRTDTEAAEDAPQKRSNAPSKAPKKEQGFLACYFCRGRKIACNAPPKDSEDRTCEQCSKRKIPCEYPTVSRRGQRNLDSKKKPSTEEEYVPKRTRTEAHLAMQGGSAGYGYGN